MTATAKEFGLGYISAVKLNSQGTPLGDTKQKPANSCKEDGKPKIHRLTPKPQV
ncbi:hypothetical protein PL8927_760048 [Planktothrix serta PCC 8927]|uniref:Uncharacterized protein n=1 Tax=Planktothrix serta PCC 8927 TaxID=671068 RepID=A0A7Z9E2N8_9CYAN|nr:hypothetical protein PL8927_760048 [Planktothrix serta PCC 8927]